MVRRAILLCYPRSYEDKHFPELRMSDPVYTVEVKSKNDKEPFEKSVSKGSP